MKRCPDCDAEYDDHVEYCFVDGADLVVVEQEVVVAPVSSATPVSEDGGSGGRGLLGLGVFFLIGGGLVVVLLGLGITAVYVGGSPDETAMTSSAVAADPRPVPVPLPVPVPEPEPEPEVLQLGFTSTPAGAAVWEGDTQLCETPCVVEHPEHAPVPRTFVLKANRYRDAEHVVDDPSLPQHVELNPIRARPRPRPRPEPQPATVAAKPDPKPAPTTAPAPTPAPAGADSTENDLGVKTNDLVDPWQQQ